MKSLHILLQISYFRCCNVIIIIIMLASGIFYLSPVIAPYSYIIESVLQVRYLNTFFKTSTIKVKNVNTRWQHYKSDQGLRSIYSTNAWMDSASTMKGVLIYLIENVECLQTLTLKLKGKKKVLIYFCSKASNDFIGLLHWWK